MDWVVPTVVVDRGGVAVTINEADFDAATMRLWGAAVEVGDEVDEGEGEDAEAQNDAPPKPRGRPRKVTGDDA